MKVTTLESYLYEMRLTSAQFAELMDCSRQHMYNVMKKRTYPSLRLSKDVFRATNGLVKLETRPIKKKDESIVE